MIVKTKNLLKDFFPMTSFSISKNDFDDDKRRLDQIGTGWIMVMSEARRGYKKKRRREEYRLWRRIMSYDRIRLSNYDILEHQKYLKMILSWQEKGLKGKINITEKSKNYRRGSSIGFGG